VHLPITEPVQYIYIYVYTQQNYIKDTYTPAAQHKKQQKVNISADLVPKLNISTVLLEQVFA